MSDPPASGEAILRAEDVVKHFPGRSGPLRGRAAIRALDGVSLELRRGEALGIVGESGSGKSTLASLFMALDVPTSGRVLYRGRDISGMSRGDARSYRREVQLIFQDAAGSLNPRMTVADIVAEPWDIHRDLLGKRRRGDALRDVVSRVGLDDEHLGRYPHQLSGGQRQRVGIARALALAPRVLICDEPVSALDVSVQAQVLNLLKDLREGFGLSYIFITHDLSVVRQIADRVAVLHMGKVVEIGDESDILVDPSHPYTRALLSAIPTTVVHQGRARKRIILSGELPDPSDPPSGCRFRTRCWKAQPLCTAEEPALVDRGNGHPVACHFVQD